MEIKDLGTFKLLDAIEAWQGDPNLHPLTCGSDNCDHVSLVGKVKTINDVLNISSQKGATIFLKCPECDYTQDFVPDCVYNWYIGTHLNHKILLGQVVEVKFDEDCGADAIFFGADYKFPEGCEFLSPSLKVEGDKEIVLRFIGKLRALVVGYARDCDETPLYCLSNLRVKYNCDYMNDELNSKMSETIVYKKWAKYLETGWPEESLTVIEGQFVPLLYSSIFEYEDDMVRSLK